MAVDQACDLLVKLSISTTSKLLSRSAEVESRWRSEVKGQRSGISWRYLLMLAGEDGIKPDRMLTRFTRRHAAGIEIEPDGFVDAIAGRLERQVDRKVIDHRIWLVERAREDA